MEKLDTLAVKVQEMRYEQANLNRAAKSCGMLNWPSMSHRSNPMLKLKLEEMREEDIGTFVTYGIKLTTYRREEKEVTCDVTRFFPLVVLTGIVSLPASFLLPLDIRRAYRRHHVHQMRMEHFNENRNEKVQFPI